MIHNQCIKINMEFQDLINNSSIIVKFKEAKQFNLLNYQDYVYNQVVNFCLINRWLKAKKKKLNLEKLSNTIIKHLKRKNYPFNETKVKNQITYFYKDTEMLNVSLYSDTSLRFIFDIVTKYNKYLNRSDIDTINKNFVVQFKNFLLKYQNNKKELLNKLEIKMLIICETRKKTKITQQNTAYPLKVPKKIKKQIDQLHKNICKISKTKISFIKFIDFVIIDYIENEKDKYIKAFENILNKPIFDLKYYEKYDNDEEKIRKTIKLIKEIN